MGLPVSLLRDINLLDVGNTLSFCGVIYGDANTHYLAYLPGEIDDSVDNIEHRYLALDNADWEKIVRQTDLLETEVLAKSADGKLCKVLVRKSTRQIEQGVSWAVFHRDGYKCRYCGIQGVPMTVDHAPVLWENSGPSIEANLVTACRKCNKTRGNLLYKDWLQNPYYIKVSSTLTENERKINEEVVFKEPNIPLRLHQRSR
jgi:hypothetical protein